MINYFNFKKFSQKILVTNDLGQYCFLSESNLNKLIHDDIDYNSNLGHTLQEKFFIYNGSKEDFLEKVKFPLRASQNHLLHCTSLHIFVLTNACNLQCIYCQARTGNEKTFGFMDNTTAEEAVDFALQSPDDYLTFEFQGGEPLTNYNVLKHIVEYTENHKGSKRIEYSLVSNLILLNDDILDFIQQYNISVSTSLDGSANVHNHNRPFVDGSPSFSSVSKEILYLQDKGFHPGAIETTTRFSLNYPKEIIDTYKALNLDTVFIRPLTPLGYANRDWKKIGYSSKEFVDFYQKCIEYIIECNKNGTWIREGHASIFLTKIFKGIDPNYMELRSPCGGIVGQLAYFYNGDIYTCDEGRMLGEMGDTSFRLGNVKSDKFDDIICSGNCRAMISSSFLQSIPECTNCVYQPYCGTCPVVNEALYGDIYPPAENYKCLLYKGMLDTIFTYLESENEDTLKILKSWVY